MTRALILSALALLIYSQPCSGQETTTIPAIDARETVWSDYVAATWGRTDGVDCFTEFRLPDASRVDIVSDYKSFLGNRRIAWEVERAKKWKESIGQAAFYQHQLDADQGGVVLLCLHDSDAKFLQRCKFACQRCGLLLIYVDRFGNISQVFPPHKVLIRPSAETKKF